MRGRWAWATAAALLVAAAFLLRLPAISEPLGIDQGLWASGARALSRGQVLYQDFWDHKPPGIFLTYLAVFNVFGWRASSVAWTDLLAALAVTALLFAVVRRESNTVTGALAAVLYATLTMPAWLYCTEAFSSGRSTRRSSRFAQQPLRWRRRGPARRGPSPRWSRWGSSAARR